MKTIFIVCDSLNRLYLPIYGDTVSQAPNFKRLAEHSITFDEHYAGSLPCMPARREMQTGNYNFLHRSWGPMEPFDESFLSVLRKNDVYTHLVTDHYHYWEDGGATYHNRFDSYDLIRGQEGDSWIGQASHEKEPAHLGQWIEQDEVNRKYLATHQKSNPLDLVFSKALEFLERNKSSEREWLLQVECFDPHEPYNSNRKFDELYEINYSGERFDWPNYDEVTESQEEVDHVRNKYRALISQIDNNLGKILDFLDKNELWSEVSVVLTTDHGFLLGEHNLWGKSVHPFYEEIVHIPLLIWNPEKNLKNVRFDNLSRTIDLAPTLLSFYGLDKEFSCTGETLFDNKARENNNKFALFGIHGGQVNITDGNVVYMKAPNKGNTPLFEYTLMPTHMKSLFNLEELRKMTLTKDLPAYSKGIPILKIPVKNDNLNKKDLQMSFAPEDVLYDINSDPKQINPIFYTDKKWDKILIKELEKINCPFEQYERLNLKK